MKQTSTLYEVKYSSKMNTSEIKNTLPLFLLQWFSTTYCLISLTWKRSVIVECCDVGLSKETYVKRNIKNACMKEKKVLQNVWV